jgi:FkbM family methyltransferase
VLRDRTVLRDRATAVPGVTLSPAITSLPRTVGRRIAGRVGPLRPDRRREHRSRVAFYSQFLAPGDLCFDIGANVGNRVAAFHALGAEVVAVEPQDGCVAELSRRYSWSSRVVVVPMGLADRPGTGVLRVASFDQISSMSDDWLAAVRSTGRFGSEQWAQDRTIPVTTLDLLIDAFGVPRFCKIDVEGFELTVLNGLSIGLPALSFEFTPECIEQALGCVDRLSTLAGYEFNYSVGESMRLARSEWVDAAAIGPVLEAFPGVPPLFGDVYARRRDAAGPGQEAP